MGRTRGGLGEMVNIKYKPSEVSRLLVYILAHTLKLAAIVLSLSSDGSSNPKNSASGSVVGLL